MKRIFLTAALSGLLPLMTHAANDAPTTVDLANHLGIKTWVSKIAMEDADSNFEVLYIKKGKVAGTILSSPAFATDREYTRVSIQASQSVRGTKFSIQTTAGPSASIDIPMHIPLMTAYPLPTVIKPGEYALGGNPPEKPASFDQLYDPRNIKNGIILRVTKRPSP